MAYVPRLKQEYKERVIKALTEEFGYKNIMEVPKLKKIVISRGVGAAVADKKLVDHAVDELTQISGQKAVATISKKDVANFKLRRGMPIGAKVHVQKLLDQTNTISSIVNKVVKQLEQTNNVLLLDQALHVLENVIESVRHAN